MKTKNLFGILMLIMFTFAFISCDKEDEEGTKVTNYQEYELTVASKKVLGMIFSEGNNYFRKVYAVKKKQCSRLDIVLFYSRLQLRRRL